MKYILKENLIEIFGKDDFVIQDILECGQVFSYQKIEIEIFIFLSQNKSTIHINFYRILHYIVILFVSFLLFHLVPILY